MKCSEEGEMSHGLLLRHRDAVGPGQIDIFFRKERLVWHLFREN